jgi:hypothetical protein
VNRNPSEYRGGRDRVDSSKGERDRNPNWNRDSSVNRDPIGNRDSSVNRNPNGNRDSNWNRNPSVNRGGRDRDSGLNRDASGNRDSGVYRNPNGSRDSSVYRNPVSRDIQRNRRNDTHRAFTRSMEGRHFNNGVTLRRGTSFTDRRWDTYFPHRYSYYPYYSPTRASFEVVFSPFHFYYGVCPPYIHRTRVLYVPPRRVYIEVPIYINNEYRGYRDTEDDYYLYRRNDTRWTNDPELKQAVYDLADAFREEDITLLTELTDPDTKIAIFSSGRYEYSLEPGDYLDMSRDFMYAAETANFDVERVLTKTSGVYQVFAKHTYRNREGDNRTVYLCFVIENISGRWAITQVDTSPDRIEN